MALTKKTHLVEKPVAAILVSMPLEPMGGLMGVAKDSLNDGIDPVLEILDGMTVNAIYKDKNGNAVHPMGQLPLLPVLEYAQRGEGHIDFVVDGTAFTLELMIPLSEAGAIPFTDDQTLEFEISFDDADIVAANVVISDFEHPVLSPVFTQFDLLSVLAGQKQKFFEITDVETILIPIKSLTVNTEVTLHHTNGRSVIYKRRDFEAMGRRANDICVSIGGLNFGGFGRYAVLDASTISKIEVRRDTTSAFDIVAVRDEVIKANLAEVEENNRALVSLSDVALNYKISNAIGIAKRV